MGTSSYTQSNTSNVLTERKVPHISIHQLDSLVNKRKYKDIFLSHSDKNGEDNLLFNRSLEQNMDDNDDILDIDSWFDNDTESSMIFIFISCIVALVAFIFLIFLCFKHEKLQRFMSFYVASPTTVAASLDNATCNRGENFLYILSAVATLCTSQIIHQILQTFPSTSYHHTFFLYIWTRQRTFDCCCPQAQYFAKNHPCPHRHLYLPITLLSVHESDHNEYYMVSGNWFYDLKKNSQPITLLHRNGVIPIRTPLTFEIGLFQCCK